MQPMMFLQWPYLIFVLPCGIAALLLLLSSLLVSWEAIPGTMLQQERNLCQFTTPFWSASDERRWSG
jgi:hypothetical protein